MNVAVPVLVAVPLLLLILLLIALLTGRRNLRREQEQAIAARQSYHAELADAHQARQRFEALATEAEQRAETIRSESALQLADATEAATQARAMAEAAQGQAEEQARQNESLERFAAELQGMVTSSRQRAETAEAEAEAARQELAALRDAAPTPSAGSAGSAETELLWALEMIRSERTWRHSVAVDPSAPSPFPDAADPLKLAVEVEAAAMREEVGAFINVHWQAEAVSDPVRRVLVLRVANELLAAAAREPQPFEMIATGSDKIALHLRATEDGDRQLTFDPPRFAADMIEFQSDQSGVRVTIH